MCNNTRAFPVSSLELKAGVLLPCVLISGLNSDLPGNMIAQLSENVYDNATGRYLLISRGSRLISTYDHQINAGQNRVLVIWNRLIFPNGSSLMLDNLRGADQIKCLTL
ncbi:MAG: TrbI/VirB10 family protein [Synergistaceae bacterium]|nr:TrbI/VirB10 family protein [Synergistaceae bacterium]